MPLNRWQKKNRSRPLKRGSGRRLQPLCGTAGRKGRKRGSHRWIDGRFWRSGKKKHEYELLWCCSGRSVDYRAAAGCLLIAAVSKAVGSHQILIDPNSSRDVTRTVTSTSLTSRDPRANSLGKWNGPSVFFALSAVHFAHLRRGRAFFASRSGVHFCGTNADRGRCSTASKRLLRLSPLPALPMFSNCSIQIRTRRYTLRNSWSTNPPTFGSSHLATQIQSSISPFIALLFGWCWLIS